jgi:hypothetical protein
MLLMRNILFVSVSTSLPVGDCLTFFFTSSVGQIAAAPHQYSESWFRVPVFVISKTCVF